MMKDWYDFLVIGSGIAGLSYSLIVAEKGPVAIITKKQESESNTNYAQGGIASVMSPVDSFEDHLNDTLSAGAGLCHQDVAEKIIKSGPSAIDRLIEIGVNFTRMEADQFSLGREGGHSHKRVLHAADLTGREIERALLAACHAHPNITIFANRIAVDLISHRYQGEITCGGAFIFNPRNRRKHQIKSAITMIAAGGAGQLYRHTTNPRIATGDGIAMAYRAGAKVANLEFMQFHPTTLSLVGKKTFLISEAVRGEGGVLCHSDGTQFMEKYHAMKDLAPRDVVARAIDTELKRSGKDSVYLDLRKMPADKIKTRFPNIYIHCLEAGIDITGDLVPVVPAAHYICGGVMTDVCGRSNVKRLYVCGESACTGMHGANRLASNSLLEAVVTAEFAAGRSIEEFEASNPPPLPSIEFPHSGDGNLPRERVIMSYNRRELKRLMWDCVGIVRSKYRLEEAVDRIELIRQSVQRYYESHSLSYTGIELRNMASLAGLIIKAAMIRTESRGLHFIVDYPDTDDVNWKKETILERKENRL